MVCLVSETRQGYDLVGSADANGCLTGLDDQSPITPLWDFVATKGLVPGWMPSAIQEQSAKVAVHVEVAPVCSAGPQR